MISLSLASDPNWAHLTPCRNFWHWKERKSWNLSLKVQLEDKSTAQFYTHGKTGLRGAERQRPKAGKDVSAHIIRLSCLLRQQDVYGIDYGSGGLKIK